MSTMELHGRTAIVTGGAVRLGRAISLALAREGANVYIHYNRSEGPAAQLRDEIIASGGTAAVGSGDLSDPRTAGSIVDAAIEALGPVSVLVNSASGFPTDTLQDVSVDAWRRTMDLTLGSPIFLTQAFAERMDKEKMGAVVNVTDMKTDRPYLQHLSYVIAKGGVDTLTKAAALALAPHIRVNAVALGVILPPPGESEEYLSALAAELPLARAGGADVVADTVVYLARNDFVTGEIIRLDGGAHLA